MVEETAKSPQGLKPALSLLLTDGLKPIPFKELFMKQAVVNASYIDCL
jgi:hypothetical protein